MNSRYFPFVAVHVTLLVILATTGFAQESTAGQSAAYNQVISANPFGWILLPWYNAEYERKVAGRATLTLSGSAFDWGDGDGFSSATTAFRYYPRGTPFRGFYLGPRIGLFWLSRGQDDVNFDEDSGQGQDDVNFDEDSGLHVGLGLEMGYAWLLGSEGHLSISIGGGATRVFNHAPIPVLRLVNVGWAF